MARNPEIEKILQAWWAWENCSPSEKAKSGNQLNELLDVVVDRSQRLYTREQILDHFYSQYKDFRLQRRKSEQVSVAQSAMKK
jgi:hypothetical protein